MARLSAAAMHDKTMRALRYMQTPRTIMQVSAYLKCHRRSTLRLLKRLREAGLIRRLVWTPGPFASEAEYQRTKRRLP
jgi:DNA-binding IclR family transcriptional regulator